MMPTLTSTDLQEYLDSAGIQAEILHLPSPTPTVEAAAQAVGVLPEQIVKSILFLIDDQPVLAISCGGDHVERRAIAALYSVGRKRVKLASAEQVLAIAGYTAGAMPPFAHRQPLPTLLDQRILANPTVYAGGGDIDALMRIAPNDILAATHARVMDLVSAPAQ